VKAMKRLSWLERLFLLVAVLLLLADLSLVFFWNRAQAEEKVVEGAIAEKASLVENLRSEMDVVELNRQLDDVRSRLEKAPFPAGNPGPMLEQLILTADQVTMREIALGEQGKENVGSREYGALISHVVASGSLASLVSYMRALMDGPFLTIHLDNVSLSQGEEGWEASLDIVLLLRGDGS
jgi:hypothetical protein